MSQTSSGTTSHVTCDRRPVATPQAAAATIARRTDVAGRAASSSRYWHPSAAARPGMSLSGRDAVTQNRGVAAVSVVMKNGREVSSPGDDARWIRHSTR